jgi:hypothetical protein
MRPFLLLLAGAAILAAAASAATPRTSLLITFWPEGRDAGSPQRWTLTCGPTGGNHPFAARACRQLEALGTAAFAPIPKDTACPQVFGGPEEALVTGRFDGRRIWARFLRRDGCETARWKRHGTLLPPVGAS